FRPVQRLHLGQLAAERRDFVLQTLDPDLGPPTPKCFDFLFQSLDPSIFGFQHIALLHMALFTQKDSLILKFLSQGSFINGDRRRGRGTSMAVFFRGMASDSRLPREDAEVEAKKSLPQNYRFKRRAAAKP